MCCLLIYETMTLMNATPQKFTDTADQNGMHLENRPKLPWLLAMFLFQEKAQPQTASEQAIGIWNSSISFWHSQIAC